MLTPEEELEKQYRDYKAEFEKWKENNKNAVGTEPYMAYVEKFEAWEREVENRREEIRAKAQEVQETQKAEAQAAAAEAKRKKELEAEEEKKKQQEAEAAAQAAAYAQHQQSYLAHHQAAIQKEQLMRQQQEAAALQTVDPGTETLDKSRMADVIQQMEQMAQMVMSGQNAESFEADGIYQQQITQPAPQSAQQIIGPPPQLWGNDRVVFDSSDSMYKRWGLRAAPPYHKPPYKPPPLTYQPPPCWLFVEQMKDEKLILPPPVNIPPPSVIPSFTTRSH